MGGDVEGDRGDGGNGDTRGGVGVVEIDCMGGAGVWGDGGGDGDGDSGDGDGDCGDGEGDCGDGDDDVDGGGGGGVDDGGGGTDGGDCDIDCDPPDDDEGDVEARRAWFGVSEPLNQPPHFPLSVTEASPDFRKQLFLHMDGIDTSVGGEFVFTSNYYQH